MEAVAKGMVCFAAVFLIVKDEEVIKVLEILEEATEVARSWKK